jgi:hypothetical protein
MMTAYQNINILDQFLFVSNSGQTGLYNTGMFFNPAQNAVSQLKRIGQQKLSL